MRCLKLLLIAAAVIFCAGCGQEASPESRAAQQPARLTEAVSPDTADGVLGGEELFLACVACHSLEQGQAHRVGPNLFGIAGQAAASRPGYTYSEALKQSGIVWNTGTLMAWVIQPEAMVPGTWMAYANYLDAAEVQRLVDYILEYGTQVDEP
jgi:cytochrome c